MCKEELISYALSYLNAQLDDADEFMLADLNDMSDVDIDSDEFETFEDAEIAVIKDIRAKIQTIIGG